ncbi:MAG: hypothetical protein C4322_21725, partial [Mastigocladus sp. ERB_26_1]
MNYLAKSSSFESVFNSQWSNDSKWKNTTATDVTQALGNVPIVKLKNIFPIEPIWDLGRKGKMRNKC